MLKDVPSACHVRYVLRSVSSPPTFLRARATAMVATAAQTAKRAFVKALLALAAAAGVAAGVTRESPDPDVLAAGRRVAEHLRAAAGGDADNPDEQHLGALRAAWELARDATGKRGRPPSGGFRSAHATAGPAGGQEARDGMDTQPEEGPRTMCAMPCFPM
jgi:hypothetical protein